MGWTPDTETASVFATISINSYIGGTFLLLFECMRGHADIFYPRKYWNKNPKITVPIPEQGWFAWIPQVWGISDEIFLETVGLDAYVFMRFLRMCFRVGCINSVLALGVLLPVYYTAPTNDNTVGINLYTMGHVHAQGRRLWASLAFTYAFTLIFLYFLYHEYEHFAEKRRLYFKGSSEDLIPTQSKYTILVENIPQEFRNNSALKRFFETIFPDEVHSAAIMVNNPLLDNLISQRNTARANLEAAIATYYASPERERPTLWLFQDLPVVCYGDKKVDAMTYWYDKMSDLCDRISKLQKDTIDASDGKVLGDNTKMLSIKGLKSVLGSEYEGIRADQISSTGFVTFKSLRTRVVACQVPVLSERYPEIKALPAAAPSDVIWENIGSDATISAHVTVLSTVAMSWGFLFWGAILAFVAAASSLQNLESIIPALNDLDPATKAILAGQLPVVVLIIFVSLLPLILGFVVRNIEKKKSLSEVHERVFRWYFKYQVANVLIIVLAGSLFGTLSSAIDNPASIATILGAALPGVSVFFINYIITQLLSGVPAILFRYVPYLILLVYRWIFNQKSLTRRMLVEGPLAQVTVDYGVELPPLLYILFIMMIYWVMAPILLLVATLFFGATYIAWKYQYLFVIVPDNEGGGRFWYGIFDYSMVGLLVSSLTMVGYMGIKEGIAQAPLILPLPAVVLVAWAYTDSKFKKLSQNLPYSSAVDEDAFTPVVKSLKQALGRLASRVSNRNIGANPDGSSQSQPDQNAPTSSAGANFENSTSQSALRGESFSSSVISAAETAGHAHAASFTTDFCFQANTKEENPVYPHPYRIQDEPLFLPNGAFNPVYYAEQEGDRNVEVDLIRRVVSTTDEENATVGLSMNDEFSNLNRPLLQTPPPPSEVQHRGSHHRHHDNGGNDTATRAFDRSRDASTNSVYSEIAGSWD